MRSVTVGGVEAKDRVRLFGTLDVTAVEVREATEEDAALSALAREDEVKRYMLVVAVGPFNEGDVVDVIEEVDVALPLSEEVASGQVDSEGETMNTDFGPPEEPVEQPPTESTPVS